MLSLGKVICEKIEEIGDFKDLLMDTDFQNRSLLDIIFTQEFDLIFHEEDPKTENIMNILFQGEEINNCDGNS